MQAPDLHSLRRARNRDTRRFRRSSPCGNVQAPKSGVREGTKAAIGAPLCIRRLCCKRPHPAIECRAHNLEEKPLNDLGRSARLQFDTCTESRRNKANDGSGRGVKRPDIISDKGHASLPHGRPACPPASKSEKYARKRSPSVVHCDRRRLRTPHPPRPRPTAVEVAERHHV